MGRRKKNAPLATEKNDVKLNLCVNPTENTRHSARQKRGKQSVALKTNKFQHCHAIHSSWMCFTELPSLWCLWTWTANSKYRMYSTEVQFIYCIFNLFAERSHCETQPSAKQSKAKHTKEQIVLLQIQFNIARIRSILECVLKNNIHWDKHVFWKNSHIVNKPSRNNAWKNGSLFIEMWLFGWVEYILWIKSNKVVSEWTRLTQLGL